MLLTIMATNNIHMNMKPIPLILRSKNSNTILSVNKIDGFFKIERICGNTHSNTYVTSIEDLLKFIDVYTEIEDFIHDYKQQLSYSIGFEKELYVKTSNKNGIKEMSKHLVGFIGKIFRKDNKKTIKSNIHKRIVEIVDDKFNRDYEDMESYKRLMMYGSTLEL